MMSMIAVFIDHKHDVVFFVQLIHHTNRRTLLLIPSNIFWYDVVTIKTNKNKTKSDDDTVMSMISS